MDTQRQPKAALVLGIDTGGTYTDGVLYDIDARRVLATHKSLTTRRDFSIGIDAVIRAIRIEDPSAVQLVSVSTTLATNAIAEGSGERVALLLVGYDPELIAAYRMQRRFATPHYHYFEGGHDLYGREKAPLDLAGILAKVGDIREEVDAVAISAYFSPLNPEHEKRAFEAVSGVCDLPVVLGHQLSSRLGSVERATTAALNASLLAVLKRFVIAVRRAMAHRRIRAPLMVVRGDGTLMSDRFAARAPVETIHSGPAASAIGGWFLSGIDDALVVDVGGTTTDIALVENGQVAVSAEGATVAGYKTAVEAADLYSIALGGDSHITPDKAAGIAIGPWRVTPIACLADRYPRIRCDLEALSRQPDARLAPDRLEYWYLQRLPNSADRLDSDTDRTLVDLLRDGPRPLPEILDRLGLFSKVQVEAGGLVRREIMAQAGLTPTDLLHADGRHRPWDADAASLAVGIFCRCLRWDPKAFHDRVWERMTETIVGAIVRFLIGKPSDSGAGSAGAGMGEWFFRNSLYDRHPHLETRFRLRIPLIGIGAPAPAFLPGVAEKLHCRLVLPEHHAVANAVGAVSGNVMVTEEVLVFPRVAGNGHEIVGYRVQCGDGQETFEEAGEALARARELARERALGAALQSGADQPDVVVRTHSDGLDAYRVRGKAVGRPRLMQPAGE